MKRLWSMILVAVLMFGMMPTANAQTNAGSATLDYQTMQFDTKDSFGMLLADGLLAQQQTLEESIEYNVIGLHIDGNVAKVEYTTLEAAYLVVAIYTEDEKQLISSAYAIVQPDVTEAAVEIQGEMPDYFLAKAYLVDTYDYSPLCTAFVTTLYTMEMQQLLNSNADDYDPELTLRLDDSGNNFAVYSEGTIIVEQHDGMNLVVNADDENSVYVLKNPDSTLRNLRSGDIFAYQYGDNQVLIAKVRTLTYDGTYVTIAGDELELAEVFSYVKIQGNADLEHATFDDSTMEEGVSYLGFSGSQDAATASAYLPSADAEPHEASRETVVQFEYEFLEKGAFEIKGNIAVKTKVYLDYYVTKSYQSVSFSVDFGGEVTVDAKVEKQTTPRKVKLGTLNIPVLPGIKVAFTPAFIVKFEASVKGGLVFSETIGFGFTCDDGDFNFKNCCKKPELTLDAAVEGKMFIGFELTPAVKILEGALADAEVSGELGFEISGKVLDVSTGDSGQIHDCIGCLDGNVAVEFKVTPSVTLLKSKKLKYTCELVNAKMDLFAFYLCAQHLDMGFGQCPERQYLTTIYTENSDGAPAANVLIKTVDGEAWGTTDANGILTKYLPSGTYTILADYGDQLASQVFYVMECRKITVRAQDGQLATADIPEDALYYNGHYYAVFNNCDSWEAARDYCRSMGGHLATITSQEENQAVYEYIRGRGYMNAYFGFSDCETEGSWTWVNGESLAYVNWNPGEPNSENEAEDYAMFYFKYDDGTWNDGDFADGTVDAGKNYICEWDGESVFSDILQDSLKDCTNIAEGIYEGNRYVLYNSYMSWEKANAYCEALGGHLATVASEAENKFIADLLRASVAQNCYWIGLSRDENNKWTWITGEPYAYSNWAPGEPNNFEDSSEKYVHMFGVQYSGGYGVKKVGQWNDASNNGADYANTFYDIENYGFICEFEDETKQHSSASDTKPMANGLQIEVTHGSLSYRPHSISGGVYETEVTEEGYLRTAVFDSLVPGEQYTVLAVLDISIENVLAPENLLYINQVSADDNGTLSVAYMQREYAKISYVFACGASGKNIEDATIELPQMVATEGQQVINPVVTCNGETLIEGVDYVLCGDVVFTEAGRYTCFIRGIKEYSGFVELVYDVYDAILGDVNGDGMVDTTDAKLIMQYDLGIIDETALNLAVADVNGDGKVDTTDAKLIMQLDLGIITAFPTP